MGGAALGRYFVEKWRMRGVVEKQLALLQSVHEAGVSLADALSLRAQALRYKLIAFNKRYRMPAWLDALLPLPRSIIRTGIRRRFRSEIRKLEAVKAALLRPLPEESNFQDQWAREILEVVQKYPVISSDLDARMAIMSQRQKDFNELIKERGLAPA